MSTLRVVTLDGDEVAIEGGPGRTIMQLIRDAGIKDLLAICDGNCACGTCHVHVDVGKIGLLPAMQDDEDAMLSVSLQRNSTSRLSCQIVFDESLDGLRVTIAAYD